MVRVRVRVFASLRERLGWKEKEVEVEADTVEGLLKKIEDEGGAEHHVIIHERGLSPHYKVFLNDKDTDSLNGLETRIRSGDSILIFPPISGGCCGIKTNRHSQHRKMVSLSWVEKL